MSPATWPGFVMSRAFPADSNLVTFFVTDCRIFCFKPGTALLSAHNSESPTQRGCAPCQRIRVTLFRSKLDPVFSPKLLFYVPARLSFLPADV
jgi:hypothetical protein